MVTPGHAQLVPINSGQAVVTQEILDFLLFFEVFASSSLRVI